VPSPMDFDAVPQVWRVVATFGLVCALTIRFAVNLFKLSDQFPQIERDGARHAPPARYGNWTENLVLLHLSPSKFGEYVDKVLPVGAVLGKLFLVQAWTSKLVNQEEAEFCSVRGCFDERGGRRVAALGTRAGCSCTLTFDQKALRLSGFEFP
jgi:hypothetical protein